MEQNAQAQAKPIKIPGPEYPISVEHNSSRVVVSVAGRIIADTREALTLDEATIQQSNTSPARMSIWRS
jgi:uncharacterized protein (DUF427 family)